MKKNKKAAFKVKTGLKSGYMLPPHMLTTGPYMPKHPYPLTQQAPIRKIR